MYGLNPLDSLKFLILDLIEVKYRRSAVLFVTKPLKTQKFHTLGTVRLERFQEKC